MSDPTRSYELTFKERDGYLYAHVKAETISEEIVRGYLREVANRCTEIDCKRLMIYREMPEMLDSATLAFITSTFADWIHNIRLAIVNPHLSPSDVMEVSQMFAIHVGAFEYIFNNVPDAEAWLLK